MTPLVCCPPHGIAHDAEREMWPGTDQFTTVEWRLSHA